MELHVIEQFLQLAKMEHMTETADFFNITQPSLSKNISKLEDEVGVRLFDRVGRRIKLNKNGENYAHYAREALKLLQAGKVSARTTRYEMQGQIRIHCRAYGPILTPCIAAYTELNPLVEFDFSYNSSAVSEKEIEDKDFILCASNFESQVGSSRQVWDVLDLFTEEQYAVVSATSPFLKGEAPASLKDMSSIPFVTMVQSDIFFRDPTFLFCLDAGFTPRIALRTDNFLIKMDFVGAGRAACFLPGSCISTAKALVPDLLVIPLTDLGNDFSRTISLMHRKESYMTETAQDFLEFVKEHFHLDGNRAW